MRGFITRSVFSDSYTIFVFELVFVCICVQNVQVGIISVSAYSRSCWTCFSPCVTFQCTLADCPFLMWSLISWYQWYIKQFFSEGYQVYVYVCCQLYFTNVPFQTRKISTMPFLTLMTNIKAANLPADLMPKWVNVNATSSHDYQNYILVMVHDIKWL